MNLWQPLGVSADIEEPPHRGCAFYALITKEGEYEKCCFEAIGLCSSKGYFHAGLPGAGKYNRTEILYC